MLKRVIIVDDDPEYLAEAADALRGAGYEVTAFLDPLAALDALSIAKSADLLVSRVDFGPDLPHGISLALMAKHRWNITQVLFTAFPDFAQEASRVGEVLIAPVSIPDLVNAVDRLLKREKAVAGADGL